MAKKEVVTDLWVAAQLTECGITFDAQGSSVREIDEALKSASKRGTGNAGFPEFVAVIGDFVLVIEDKPDTARHIKLTDSGILDTSVKAVTDYAVNGAYFYAKHIAQNTNFRKVFAVGVSGDGKYHRITPLYVDDRESYKTLPDLESFTSFSPRNIGEYYTHCVLEEKTDVEKTTEEILRDAAELHEALRTYGALKDQDKPLVVAGILLALDELEYSFSIGHLRGETFVGGRDGDILMEAIRKRLTRSNVGPDAKKDKLLAEFSILQNSVRLNEYNDTLGKTPLRYYTEFLHERIFKSLKYREGSSSYSGSSEDFIGRFYGEFMSYSGGDGQTLGIILTPRHICDLMCELVDVTPDDVVLDPTCGTAGFLIAAMHRMLSGAKSEQQKKRIRQQCLHGFELQSNMFAVAATNMILRRDGNSNLECCDFLRKNPAQAQMKGATVGLMNPPYSQGTKADPQQYELSFIKHLLDSLVAGARAAVIVPQSSMTGKTKDEQNFKTAILQKHTLEGVITCNIRTFYGVGTNPVIAVFTAHEPHDAQKVCKFIDFREDGYEVRAHVGLVETEAAKDRRAHLLDVWRGRIEAPSKFCVQSTVEPDDEWLHSFYYFNDEIPTQADFEKAIGDYLTFEFSMIMQGREYLFTKRISKIEYKDIVELAEVNWHPFYVADVFTVIARGKRLKKAEHTPGMTPYVSSTAMNNGVDGFIEAVPGTRVFSDCISLANSGSVGSAFYEPFDFVASDHVTHLKREGLSKWTYLFLAAALEKQGVNFNFNREINDARISKMQIMLPADSEGKPDFSYMEQYAKNMMRRKYERYLAYLHGQPVESEAVRGGQ